MGMSSVGDPRSFGLVLADAVLFLMDGPRGGYRPGRVVTDEPGAAAELRAALAPLNIEVVEQSGSIEALDAPRAEFRRFSAEESGLPEPTDVKGVTLAHLRAFAEAAQEFHRAAPWKHLLDEDLIEIDSAGIGKAFRCAAVLGAAGTECGLAFFSSPEQYERLSEDPDAFDEGTWSILFGGLGEMAPDEGDLWVEHALPADGDLGYPVFVLMSPTVLKRPDAKALAFGEGVLRAIAQTSEKELDRGRWSKSVPTIEGERTYEFSLPGHVELGAMEGGARGAGAGASEGETRQRGGQSAMSRNPSVDMERIHVDMARAMRGRTFESEEDLQKFFEAQFEGRVVEHQPGGTPTEMARDLLFEAADAQGRHQLHLIRRALELHPDSPDAFVLLAARGGSAEERSRLYAQGVEAGERSLGREFFNENAGHFWGIVETRPYMRARMGLAETLVALERDREAVEHLRELMRLNPNDNQGCRDLLGPLLVAAGELAAAKELLSRFAEDTAEALYIQAVIALAEHGDTPATHQLAMTALKSDPLLGVLIAAPFSKMIYDRVIERGMPMDIEVQELAAWHRRAWVAVPAALEWLVSVLTETLSDPPSRKRPSKKRRVRPSKSKRRE